MLLSRALFVSSIRKLLSALAVAILVSCLLAPRPAFAVPQGRVEVSEELEVGLDTLMEVVAVGPAEVVEGDTAKVSITLRAIRPLEVRFLYVYLQYFPVSKLGGEWHYWGWLPLASVKVLEKTNVSGGWSTTIEREVKFREWGDVVVEVWLSAYYTDWLGERKYASVTVYFPLTKVKPELLPEAERYRELYESLSANYSALFWMYKGLNESYANLEKRYTELADRYSALYRNYTQLRSEYDALKREREAYTALAVAALLAAVGVAAYGWVKTVRAGKAQQHATKPAAQEAGGG
jgi:hypothetical protein